MGANKRVRAKGRREAGTFALIPGAVIDSATYAALSWQARALLLELAAMFRGNDDKRRTGNNGDLSAAHALHKERGWHRSTLQAAAVELEDAGFIVRTRQGGRHACNLYALTWRPIDHCDGKLDSHVRIGGAPLKLWEKSVCLARNTGYQPQN